MRNLSSRYLVVLLALVASSAGCKWGDFDDLADKTWVHSSDKPNIGSTDYALSIIGVTSPGSTTGGQLAVISNDSPNYSTLDYTDAGEADVGPNNQPLGHHFIASLTNPPIFVTDGMGKIALVERALDAGNIAVVIGPAGAVGDTPFPSPNTPDAATFVGANLVIAAGSTFYTLSGMGVPASCMSNVAGFKAAALASDGTNLFVWQSGGVFGAIPVAGLTACTGGMVPGFGPLLNTGNPGPAAGAKIHLVGNYAILAGHGESSQTGQVIVVDTTTMTEVGTPLTLDGLASSTVGVLGTSTYLALGIPTRNVDGIAAGQVEVYQFDTTTGTLGSPVMTLNDAQPDSGQEFGRNVTTMKFNNQQILVVGAKSEVFAYYKTSLYDHLPQ
jgi:hypothetical protein